MTLTEFLLARIAEDEADTFNYFEIAARHERESRRRIIAACLPDYRDSLTNGDDTTSLAEEVLVALALPYADHPDYREEWKP